MSNGQEIIGNILLVDDTPANLRLLAGMLSEQGFLVRPVPSGELALQAVQASPPDLILLDINMPGMDGYAVAEQLQANAVSRAIPIIFISALDEVMDKVRAFQAGGVDYITKPFQLEEVLARVATHLSLRRMQTQLQRLNEELEARVRERTAELTQLNRSLERFVPKALLEHLGKKSLTEIEPGDHVQGEMAVMFSDIRGFTALSERLSPQESFRYLNDYLGLVSPIIRDNHGFVDKYLGDGVMAVFPESPENAIQAAVDMQSAVEVYNQGLEKRALPRIKIGIGINTGKVMLGMLGEAERIQGTVISDVVNVASRLEGLTKQYDIKIAVCQGTMQAVQDSGKYHFRFIDRVKAVGRMGTMNVYEVFDSDAPEGFKNKRLTLSDFESGLELYYRRQFAEASVAFNSVLKQNPGDKVAQIYLQRSGFYLANGVPADWNGIEQLKVK